MPAEPCAPAPPPGVRYAGIADEAAPTLTGQLAALRELGWDAIELRTVDGCAVADLGHRAFGELVERLAASRVDVVCVDSRIANWARPVTHPFEDDADELRILARRCAALGTRRVRVMSYPNSGLPEGEWRRRVLHRMTALARQAEDHGLMLLHENCSGWAGSDARRMLDLLGEVDSPALRLLFDIGNGVPHGYDAPALLDAVIGHVDHVHVKDARYLPGGPGSGGAGVGGDGVAYTLPGHGRSGVRECLTALLRHGYTGAWSIEPHTRLRPHDGTDTRAGGSESGDGSEDGVAAFVAYGRELARLVQREVLPALGASPDAPARSATSGAVPASRDPHAPPAAEPDEPAYPGQAGQGVSHG